MYDYVNYMLDASNVNRFVHCCLKKFAKSPCSPLCMEYGAVLHNIRKYVTLTFKRKKEEI